MKIVSIVGARPQFVKLGPFSRALRKKCNEIIVHTGQHYDEKMSDTFFNQLNIPRPDYNLHIGSGSHGKQTGQMLQGIEEVLLKEKPDAMVVFGDTNSTVAGALAATKLHIPVIHIEAGLRSFNRSMPEEINRIATDCISNRLYAPTQTAVDNLRNEGLEGVTVLTGDIMVDAVLDNLEVATATSSILSDLDLKANDYSLVTLHRPYNVDDPKKLAVILNKISQLDDQVVFPVHPRTRGVIEQNQISVDSKISLVDPVSYLDFLALQKSSRRILTDSGGIQKEAYIMKRPCVTLRTETEWVETVKEGWNLLIDVTREGFVSEVMAFRPPENQADVFGKDVANTMVDDLYSHLAKG